MRYPKGVVDSNEGLFLFTDDGIFKFDKSANCFKEVELRNSSNVIIASIGTVNDDPREEN